MTDKMTTDDMWDFLLQNVSVSEDTLQVVSAICDIFITSFDDLGTTLSFLEGKCV